MNPIHNKPQLSTGFLSRRLRFVGVYRLAMKKIIGRLNDWRHERFIAYLRKQFRVSYEAGQKDRARHFWSALAGAIQARSPESIDRIEMALQRRLGMR